MRSFLRHKMSFVLYSLHITDAPEVMIQDPRRLHICSPPAPPLQYTRHSALLTGERVQYLVIK